MSARASLARRARAGGVAAATALAAATLGMLPSGPAQAAPGRCEAGTGVTVVVDYGALGGGVVIGCDSDGAGKPGSEVVPDAGFPLDYVRTEPGFVCAIASKPDPATSCQRTPPSDRYWGLFWSDGSSSTWKYSSSGVGALEVPAGGSIGWRWQSSGTKRVPGAPPTQEPRPAPAPSPSSGSGSTGGTGGGSGGAGSATAGPTRAPSEGPTRGTTSDSDNAPSTAAAAAANAPGERTARAGDDDRRKQGAEKTPERADASADVMGADETDEDTEVTAADSELVQPVSDEGGGTSPADLLLLVVAGLAAAGLAAYGVVTARRRRV